jgi:hypothetical protein
VVVLLAGHPVGVIVAGLVVDVVNVVCADVSGLESVWGRVT